MAKVPGSLQPLDVRQSRLRTSKCLILTSQDLGNLGSAKREFAHLICDRPIASGIVWRAVIEVTDPVEVVEVVR